MPNRYGLASLFILLLATACGSGNLGSGPCDGPNPPASCGAACTSDQECDPGYHCNPQNECYAECTPGGNECPNGYTCDQNGRCQPGNTTPDGGDDNCPRVQVDLDPQTPTVQLLIDQSGSMTQAFGNTNRWIAVRNALVGQDGAVTQLEDKVIFGATLYSSINGSTTGNTCPLLVSDPPAFNNRQDIAALFANNAPQEDTPTAESITAVANAFPPENPDAPGPRIIVLATDGDPDNCADPDAHDQSSQILSEMATQAAYAKGIQTYVLSVGNEVSEPHLQRLANAGQGLPLDSGNATFYVANNPAELVNAFQQILGGARTCTFTVNGAVTQPETGTVELNGVTLEYGIDWIMPDQTTLELLGDACTTFLNEQDVALSAEFECGTVVL